MTRKQSIGHIKRNMSTIGDINDGISENKNNFPDNIKHTLLKKDAKTIEKVSEIWHYEKFPRSYACSIWTRITENLTFFHWEVGFPPTKSSFYDANSQCSVIPTKATAKYSLIKAHLRWVYDVCVGLQTAMNRLKSSKGRNIWEALRDCWSRKKAKAFFAQPGQVSSRWSYLLLQLISENWWKIDLSVFWSCMEFD